MASRTDLRRALIRGAFLGLAALAAVLVVLLPRSAAAYPWMIRHGAVQCGTCHADPSGSGLLTSTGRARGETSMRFHWGAPSGDVSKGKFLFGLDTPEGLLLGGSIRNGYLRTRIADAPAQPEPRFLQMQADLRAQLTVDRLRGHLTFGFLHEGGRAAWVTRRDENNLVSREHWLGVDLGDDKEWLVRAGRLNLPFGVRGNEHTLWVRQALRTDINDGQQHGAAVAYAAGDHRAEAMVVVGNLQMKPDVYREQGLVGYYEHALGKRAAIGASALFLRTSVDRVTGGESSRHGYGLFARVSPIKPLVFLVEADALLGKPRGQDLTKGYVGFLQADVEPIQGIHVMLTGEGLRSPGATDTSLGGWLSLAWFFAPHADLRIDGIYQAIPGPSATTKVTSLLGQVHVYL